MNKFQNTILSEKDQTQIYTHEIIPFIWTLSAKNGDKSDY
jgi:hypothetical protein